MRGRGGVNRSLWGGQFEAFPPPLVCTWPQDALGQGVCWIVSELEEGAVSLTGRRVQESRAPGRQAVCKNRRALEGAVPPWSPSCGRSRTEYAEDLKTSLLERGGGEGSRSQRMWPGPGGAGGGCWGWGSLWSTEVS